MNGSRLHLTNMSSLLRIRHYLYVFSFLVAFTCYGVVRNSVSILSGSSRTHVLKAGAPKSTNPDHDKHSPTYSDLVLNAPSIPDRSLAAVLTVASKPLVELDHVLQTILQQSSVIGEIMVLCIPSRLSECRAAIRKAVELADPLGNGTPLDNSLPEVLLHPWLNETSIAGSPQSPTSLLSELSSQWFLILGEDGLDILSGPSRGLLLSPKAAILPIGMRGVSVRSDKSLYCEVASNKAQEISYLLPPFIAPRSSPWFSSPNALQASSSPAILYPYSENKSSTTGWCPFESNSSHDDDPSTREETIGTLAFVLPTVDDLTNFSRTMCHFRSRGFRIHVIIYDEHQGRYASKLSFLRSSPCSLPYYVITRDPWTQLFSASEGWEDTFLDWLRPLQFQAVVTFSLAIDDIYSNRLLWALKEHLPNATHIALPPEDLSYSDWIGALNFYELQNWQRPHLDISIITHRRPESLARLLKSLSAALLYGDTIKLRIHMEDSADAATQHLVRSFQWVHGEVFLHHRVIHGGLLPAVVESWYPTNNDTYGLLLEDDIELSPLFYAWIKMTLLRYRYGSGSNKDPRLFGISLYQQKVNELHMQGRKAFNARKLLKEAQISDYDTPYLSQIPCSWGGVFFPEHWREFHDYLVFRLSEATIKIKDKVVLDVRSNKWTKSWKKYFIELVHLRGYVMLYPNFERFVSLSTNHLEVGAHVKAKSKASQEQFLLPLMPLSPTTRQGVGLLELPEGKLPAWKNLPTVNFTGSLTSLEAIGRLGRERRVELVPCSKDVEMFSIADLECRDEQYR